MHAEPHHENTDPAVLATGGAATVQAALGEPRSTVVVVTPASLQIHKLAKHLMDDSNGFAMCEAGTFDQTRLQADADNVLEQLAGRRGDITPPRLLIGSQPQSTSTSHRWHSYAP